MLQAFTPHPLVGPALVGPPQDVASSDPSSQSSSPSHTQLADIHTPLDSHRNPKPFGQGRGAWKNQTILNIKFSEQKQSHCYQVYNIYGMLLENPVQCCIQNIQTAHNLKPYTSVFGNRRTNKQMMKQTRQ